MVILIQHDKHNSKPVDLRLFTISRIDMAQTWHRVIRTSDDRQGAVETDILYFYIQMTDIAHI